MTHSHSIVRLTAVLALALISGCASVRQTRSAVDPVQVYIGDYGIHSSLFLPTRDNQFVEYAFGDWGYAVENRNMPQDAIGALTMSWGAGLGRMYHPCCAETAEPKPTRKPVTIRKVICERADVYALIDRLDARFERLALKSGPPVINPETGTSWVREDSTKRYSIANNCNHMTARTLEELGCRVSGWVIWSKFTVRNPPAPPPQSQTRTAERVPGWAATE